MQALNVVAAFQGGANEVHGVCGRINDRRSRDPNKRIDVGGAQVAVGDCGRAAGCAVGRVEKRDLPEWSGVGAAVVVGVEGVDAVVFGSDEDDVVGAFAGDRDVRHVERLSVDLRVHGLREKFAEGGGIYVCSGEDGFVGVGAGARVVVVLGGYALRRRAARVEQQREARE